MVNDILKSFGYLYSYLNEIYCNYIVLILVDMVMEVIFYYFSLEDDLFDGVW